MGQILIQIFALVVAFATASIPYDAPTSLSGSCYESKSHSDSSTSKIDVVAAATNIPTDGFLADSRYSTSSQEHEDKMNLLVSQCRFPKSFMGARKKKIVIKRSLSRSHCVRRHEYKADSIQLDLSSFTRLLRVEPLDHGEIVPEPLRNAYKKGELVATAEVEAMASMETLVDALLPLGLVPAVVPEFKGITIGGSIQGLAAESSSFKYGFVHDCVAGFEALLADGRRLWCSPSENRELFEAIPGSFGSLGICTRARVLCMRAKPHVELTLRRHTTHQAAVDYMATLQDAALSNGGATDVSYLEGLGFSQDFFATIEGRFVAEPSKGTPRRHCNGFGDKWFYNQVMDALRDVEPGDSADVRTLHYDTKSYLFRHDRGSFWMASYRIPQIIAQYVMGSLLDSSNMFLLATALPWAFPKHQILLQDFMLPRNTVDLFFQKLQKLTPLYPVWLLPMRNIETKGSIFTAPSPFSIAASTDAVFGTAEAGAGPGAEREEFSSLSRRRERERSPHLVNVGAYGIPRGSYDFESANRRLESLLSQHGGRKVFYSHAFYDDKTFYDELYDGERYFKLREKYGAEGVLPEIFEKVVTKPGRL